MPKHHEKKPHHKGVGEKLAGKPDELIKLLIKDPEEKEWAIDQVINEGPDHKQLFSALLLKRMYKLVEAVEKNSGTQFAAQKGAEIISAKPEHELIIPIQLPSTIIKKEQMADVLKTLSHAPEHELTAFTILLQAIEWSIKAVNKKE